MTVKTYQPQITYIRFGEQIAVFTRYCNTIDEASDFIEKYGTEEIRKEMGADAYISTTHDVSYLFPQYIKTTIENGEI